MNRSIGAQVVDQAQRNRTGYQLRQGRRALQLLELLVESGAIADPDVRLKVEALRGIGAAPSAPIGINELSIR